MTAGDEYLPVPTKSRDLKVRPAIVKVSDEIDDLDLIAIVDGGRVVGGALDDDQVVLDRDAPRIDLELSQQFTDRQRTGELIGIAVQGNRHRAVRPPF
jgi:hypothetical protein